MSTRAEIRFLKGWRLFVIPFLAVNIAYAVRDVLVSHFITLALNGTAVALLGGVMAFQTSRLHRLQQQDRPRPDYAAIAAMERELFPEEMPVSGPLHAYEITPGDAAFIRMMAGARFGPGARVTLPSGKTITGDEMQQWISETTTTGGNQ